MALRAWLVAVVGLAGWTATPNAWSQEADTSAEPANVATLPIYQVAHTMYDDPTVDQPVSVVLDMLTGPSDPRWGALVAAGHGAVDELGECMTTAEIPLTPALAMALGVSLPGQTAFLVSPEGPCQLAVGTPVVSVQGGMGGQCMAEVRLPLEDWPTACADAATRHWAPIAILADQVDPDLRWQEATTAEVEVASTGPGTAAVTAGDPQVTLQLDVASECEDDWSSPGWQREVAAGTAHQRWAAERIFVTYSTEHFEQVWVSWLAHHGEPDVSATCHCNEESMAEGECTREYLEGTIHRELWRVGGTSATLPTGTFLRHIVLRGALVEDDALAVLLFRYNSVAGLLRRAADGTWGPHGALPDTDNDANWGDPRPARQSECSL